jgi:uncharacterized protein YbjT (DUF2867 family)
MIVVTGATGNVGGEVVAALSARGQQVRAVVRDPQRATVPTGVEVVQGDLELPESLTPSLAGADGVFLLGGWGDMTGLMRRIVDAGVRHVVLLSSRCVIGGRADNPITHMWLDSEAAVRDSGIDWTILRPSSFHANALRWLPQLRERDLVQAPWPRVAVASIDPADIAAVAARALTEPGHERTELALSGPEALTPGQQVAILADVLERRLRYEPLSDEAARTRMATDTPPPLIEAFFRFYSDGEFDDSKVLDTVERITGRPPRTFADWARAHVPAFVTRRQARDQGDDGTA